MVFEKIGWLTLKEVSGCSTRGAIGIPHVLACALMSNIVEDGGCDEGCLFVERVLGSRDGEGSGQSKGE